LLMFNRMLSLDIPQAPLFKDEYERNIIPQVPLFSILSKFDGETVTTVPLKSGEEVEKRTYMIKELPQYLIMHFKRFSENLYFKEKNPTIINFPIKDLDMRDCKFQNGIYLVNTHLDTHFSKSEDPSKVP